MIALLIAKQMYCEAFQMTYIARDSIPDDFPDDPDSNLDSNPDIQQDLTDATSVSPNGGS